MSKFAAGDLVVVVVKGQPKLARWVGPGVGRTLGGALVDLGKHECIALERQPEAKG